MTVHDHTLQKNLVGKTLTIHESSHLVPSNFHPFPKMKAFLGGKRMATDEEVKETVTDWLNGLGADFYDGTVKLLQRLDKRLNRNGDYVEK
jgi:hypothetical protein